MIPLVAIDYSNVYYWPQEDQILIRKCLYWLKTETYEQARFYIIDEQSTIDERCIPQHELVYLGHLGVVSF